LDASRNTALTSLRCDGNQFSATALNDMFETLHDNADSYSEVHISTNPGTEDCDADIAEKKGWKVIKVNH